MGFSVGNTIRLPRDAQVGKSQSMQQGPTVNPKPHRRAYGASSPSPSRQQELELTLAQWHQRLRLAVETDIKKPTVFSRRRERKGGGAALMA